MALYKFGQFPLSANKKKKKKKTIEARALNLDE